MGHDTTEKAHLLSYGQEQQYWRERRGERTSPSLPVSCRIDGPLDVTAFATALHAMTLRHDALRLRIVEDADGRPGQLLREPPPKAGLLTLTQVNARSEDQFAAFVAKLRRADLLTPWNLAEQWPFRFRLLRCSPELHVFLADLPRLTTDGRARSVFVRDLWDHYARAVEAGGTLPAIRSAGDLLGAVRRQRDRFDGRSSTVNRAYWEKKFGALTEAAPDGPPDETDAQTPQPALTRYFSLSGPTLGVVRDHCRLAGASMFQWLLACFAAEVFRRSPRTSIDLTLPMDTRGTGEADLMGKWAISLPLRIPRCEDPGRILRGLKAEILQTMRHRHITEADLLAAGRPVPAGRPRHAVNARSRERAAPGVISLPGGVLVTDHAFAPRVDYGSDGLDLAVGDFPHRTGVSVRFDPRDHTAADADAFTEALHRQARQPVVTEGNLR
ncbi:condensation domain-containing protein [Streptomyces spinosus]|uniref:condensation domain-containing protein n=1 Tax=Streptomyces spinosus TaxID=2872623 RepID=UPI001CEC963F|nr:condensation domain-containing protein [Streptomyces spinosus]